MEAFSRLGIDWNSVILYLINFGILAVVVGYFVTGPILRILDQRRQHIQSAVEEAEKLKQEFLRESKKFAQEKQQLQAEMARQLSLLQSDLDQKRKAQEDALALKKSKMIEEIRALADEEKKNIIKTAEKAVLGTMTKVILHIVSNKVPANVVQESVSDAWKHYQQ